MKQSTVNGHDAKNKKRKLTDSVLQENDSDEGVSDDELPHNSSNNENETADEKRVRLAKEYLSKLEAERVLDGEDTVAKKLEQDNRTAAKKHTRKVATKLVGHKFDSTSVRVIKGHQLPATCVVVSEDERFAWTAAKDSTIVKWDLETCIKLLTIHQSGKQKRENQKKGKNANGNGHSGAVLALALSSDGKFLASGGVDKIIRIWNASDGKHLHNFAGHRGPVTGVAFQRGTRQLFSCSEDRTVKIWSMDNMAYIDTLFGHQSEVMGIDSYHSERCITVGMDRTVRVWKVVEGTQLIFKGHTSAIDTISILDEETYVTGSQDGSIAFWSTGKKKPIKEIPSCHEGVLPWVCSVSSLHHADLVASGGSDGQVHLWHSAKASQENVAVLEKVNTVHLPGFVNGLAFTPSGNKLIAAIGQEHRLGRWARIPAVKNGIAIIQLGLSNSLNNLGTIK